MNTQRHLTRRSPRKKGRFCWSRQFTDGVGAYRLFLRSETTGRCFYGAAYFHQEADRNAIAAQLWKERRQLRDTVDAFDLLNLGVTT